MSLIAIEFDDDQLLVVTTRNVGKQVVIDESFAIDFRGLNEAEMIAAVKAAMGQRNLSRSDVIGIIRRSAVEIRELEIPPAPDNELPNLVKFLARTEFAALNDQWLLDFVPLSDHVDRPRKVLAAGVPPERVRRFNLITEAAGLKLKQIVLRPFAVFDLLRAEFQDQQVRLVIDSNTSQTDLVLAAGPQVLATRSVRLPVVSDDQPQQVTALVAEVKRTLASSTAALRGLELREIALLGDADTQQTLVTGLSQAFAVPVSTHAPFATVKCRENFQQPTAANRFAGSLGAIKQVIREQRPALDFLNPRQPMPPTSDRSRHYLYGGLATAVALLAMLLAWWTLRSQAAELATLSQRIETITRNHAGGLGRPSVDQILGEVNRLDQWKQSDINWLEELYQTSNRFLTPDEAIVDTLDAFASQGGQKINLRIRTAKMTNEQEQKLWTQLANRPYRVDTPKVGVSDDDPNYPMSADFSVELERDADEVIKLINQHAREMLTKHSEVTAPKSPTK